MESKRGSRSFRLEISFCFVASLSKCMSSLFYFGWSFDSWSALICTCAQYPWEITHHCRTLIRFLLISVSVLGTNMVSLFLRCCRCHICWLQHSGGDLTELGLLPASSWRLVTTEIWSYQSSSRFATPLCRMLTLSLPRRTCLLSPFSHALLPHFPTNTHFPLRLSNFLSNACSQLWLKTLTLFQTIPAVSLNAHTAVPLGQWNVKVYC